MKKVVILVSIICIFCICICGCSNKKNNDSNIDTSESSNPFELEKNEESGTEVMASYGWWISNYDIEKRCIEYDNDVLKLDITFDNSDIKCETGIMIFIDGIAQKYRMGEKDDSEYILPITLEPNKESTYSLSFEPHFGMDGTEHEMYIAAMYNPSYRADEGQGFGNYHKFLPGLPWKIITKKSCEFEKVDKHNNSIKLSDETKEKYKRNKSDGTVENKLDNMNICKFLQDNKEISSNTIDISKKIDINIFGGTVENYRLSVFVDNQLTPAFNGKCYTDVNIKKDYMEDLNIELEKSIIKDGEHTSMFVVTCPISYEGYNEDYMIEKTESSVLIKK